MTAAERIGQLAAEAVEGDLVITCFTGGRSALLSLPPDGVTFEEKRCLNELLLASGMPIAEVNTVRKHVSAIKGGRLARRIAPARIVNLTVSDVADDRLDILADLTTQDTSSPADALDILRRRELIDPIPGSVAAHLRSAEARSPDLADLEITTVMLANGRRVCEAMAEAARRQGLRPVIASTNLEGDARWIGSHIANLAIRRSPSGPEAGTALIGCGGEATVDLGTATFGFGGPNQEAAIAAALALEGHPVAALFLDTDGSDGGTAHAGAICDGATAQRAQELGLDLAHALASHTATETLSELGDLVDTGPTGTNVNDLFVAVAGS